MFYHRKKFGEEHGIPYSRMRKVMPNEMRQLENCKNEEAIRLLLGIKPRGGKKCR